MRKWIMMVASGVLLLVMLLVVSGAFQRTWEYSRCADGLVTLMSLSESEMSWNPWSKDMFLVRPRMAEWLLKNTEAPYECFRFNDDPAIHIVLAARGLGSAGADARLMSLLHELLKRGEGEKRSQGLTPLHSAVLFCDVVAVRTLLEAGVDTTAKIESHGRRHDGLNAAEFSALLAGQDDVEPYSGCRSAIAKTLSSEFNDKDQ